MACEESPQKASKVVYQIKGGSVYGVKNRCFSLICEAGLSKWQLKKACDLDWQQELLIVCMQRFFV